MLLVNLLKCLHLNRYADDTIAYAIDPTTDWAVTRLQSDFCSCAGSPPSNPRKRFRLDALKSLGQFRQLIFIMKNVLVLNECVLYLNVYMVNMLCLPVLPCCMCLFLYGAGLICEIDVSLNRTSPLE